jgi:16S rRNA (guanine527-N7)-methyltransferase
MTQPPHDPDVDHDGRGTGQTGPAPVVASPADPPAPPAAPSAAPPSAPLSAARVFGPRLAMAEAFVAILADTGVTHGLIGPREVPILWERHVLNCAVVSEAFPEAAEIVDVGSGAGLPGLALAIARPDLHVHLVEPMLRRTTWLSDTITALGLDRVEVHRGRAEEFHGRLAVPYATARAVARIDKLARWTFPLLQDGGTLVALKGSQAAEELAADEPVLRRLGLVHAQVRSYGAQDLEVPTVTLELTVGARPAGRRASKGAPKAKSSRRRA